MTAHIGEDVNNGWTGHVATGMDIYAVLKDATLSSDWSCKAISNLFVLDEGQLGWIDGRTHHCDTLSHVI